MYHTADGKKKFGSAFAGKRYDREHSAEEPSNEKDAKKKLGNVLEDKSEDLKHEAGESKEFEAGEQEGMKEVHPVVAQHGKANSVHIKHDHVAKKHHVTSVHEDGHTNESDHSSDMEAHDEGRKLAGVAGEPEGSPEEQGGGMEEDGFEMPSL